MAKRHLRNRLQTLLFHLLDGFPQSSGIFAKEPPVSRLRVVRSDISGRQKEFGEERQFHVDARLGVSGLGWILTRRGTSGVERRDARRLR